VEGAEKVEAVKDVMEAITIRRDLDHKCLAIAARFAKATTQDLVDAALYSRAVRALPDRCLSAPMFPWKATDLMLEDLS
jgi:hypothetical protein